MLTAMTIKRPRRVRLADVARAADVSVSTASRALNGYPEITASTRARIEEIAHRLGYRAHATARTLRMGDVGMVVAVLDPESLHPAPGRISHFWSRLLTDVTSGLSERGMATLTVMNEQAPALLGGLPYEAALVMSTRRDIDQVLAAVPFGVPLVSPVGHQVPNRRHVSLGHDYRAAAQAVLEHFRDAGAHSPLVLLPDMDHTFVELMAAGCAQVAHEHHDVRPRVLRTRGEGFGELVAHELAAGADAIFSCLTDGPATLAAVRAAGAEPGIDVLVAVLSDGPVEAYTTPPVTTLAFLPEQSAVAVVGAVETALAGGSGAVLLQFRLDVRASSRGPLSDRPRSRWPKAPGG
ncbi:MAG: hypothetical protein QG597_3281 [Actinomycetota bacterium]|nr:hypothetical protein [Actinomycetota bacterium]